jgi:hypothetical protein
MFLLPTVGPLELVVILLIGVLVAFGAALVVRLKRMWRRAGRRGRGDRKR